MHEHAYLSHIMTSFKSPTSDALRALTCMDRCERVGGRRGDNVERNEQPAASNNSALCSHAKSGK